MARREEVEAGYPGVLSVIVDDAGATIRKLPSLYFGKSQVFADRSVERVAMEVVRFARLLDQSAVKSLYHMSACRVGERAGIYFLDTFNRSIDRRRLTRAGLEIADDPVVELLPDGRMANEQWGAFDPSFIVVRPRDHSGGNARGKGMTAFTLAFRRLGAIAPAEMAVVTSIARTLDRVEAGDPDALVASVAGAG